MHDQILSRSFECCEDYRPLRSEFTASQGLTIENLYKNIGMYVVMFQGVEFILDECLRLLQGGDDLDSHRRRISRMSIQEKIDRIRLDIYNIGIYEIISKMSSRDDFLEDLITRLHDERLHRNSLIHSQYILNFVKIGESVIKSHLRKAPGKFELDIDDIDLKYQDEMIIRLFFWTLMQNNLD